MLKLYILPILILAVLEGVESKGIDSFITRLIQKYPEWLAIAGKDPSYVVTDPAFINLQGPESCLTGEITNVQISGVLNYNLTLQDFSYEAPDVSLVSRLYLYLLIGGSETVYTGSYQVNGTLNGKEVRGVGTWSAKPDPGTSYRLLMEYQMFTFENLNDQIHLGLKRSPFKIADCGFWGTRTFTMTGLTAGGSEEQVKNVVLNSYFSQMRYSKRLPLQGQFLVYVEDAFESNPYHIIINDGSA